MESVVRRVARAADGRSEGRGIHPAAVPLGIAIGAWLGLMTALTFLFG